MNSPCVGLLQLHLTYVRAREFVRAVRVCVSVCVCAGSSSIKDRHWILMMRAGGGGLTAKAGDFWGKSQVQGGE